VLRMRLKDQGVAAQLVLLCACGRRPVELKGLGCCSLCYYRQYRSWRWFGGLREAVLRRDCFSCRACGARRRLIVHHREERNAKDLLITLCIRCHVRLHRSRRFRYWVPEVLLGLWRELHPGGPLQLQLPLTVTNDSSRQLKRRAKEPSLNPAAVSPADTNRRLLEQKDVRTQVDFPGEGAGRRSAAGDTLLKLCCMDDVQLSL
jgi:hypothetical protein